jgi:hypothetical protein
MIIYSPLLKKYAREIKTMPPETNTIVRSVPYGFPLYAAAVSLLVFVCLFGGRAEATVNQRGFSTPDEAVKAFVAALKSNDREELLSVFGAEADDLISSGDAVNDKQKREKFIAEYDLKNSLTKEGDKMILVIGEKEWPFPVPLVKKGLQWIFDTMAGKEEILNRRIGENELKTIQTMLAIVDAQREYARKNQDNDSLPEYAQKFMSDPGKRNGLYWQTDTGEAPSPLGELAANARAEGYNTGDKKDTHAPFHGYIFRMLVKQGKHAFGGAFDYLVKGQQIGGFAIIAYPATHGNSGVMTFIVNHDGVVYQKDLGKNTAKIAKKMTAFDPDQSWKKTE